MDGTKVDITKRCLRLYYRSIAFGVSDLSIVQQINHCVNRNTLASKFGVRRWTFPGAWNIIILMLVIVLRLLQVPVEGIALNLRSRTLFLEHCLDGGKYNW